MVLDIEMILNTTWFLFTALLIEGPLVYSFVQMSTFATVLLLSCSQYFIEKKSEYTADFIYSVTYIPLWSTIISLTYKSYVRMRERKKQIQDGGTIIIQNGANDTTRGPDEYNCYGEKIENEVNFRYFY